MKCEFDKIKIYKYFDNELSERESAELLEHMFVCPACDALFHEIKEMVNDVRLLSRDLPETTLACALKEIRGDKKRKYVKKFSFALAAAACLVMSTFLLKNTNRSDYLLYEDAANLPEACMTESGQYGDTLGEEGVLPPPAAGASKDAGILYGKAFEEETDSASLGIYLTKEEYAQFKELLSARLGAQNIADAVINSEEGRFSFAIEGMHQEVKEALEEIFEGECSALTSYSILNIYIVS